MLRKTHVMMTSQQPIRNQPQLRGNSHPPCPSPPGGPGELWRHSLRPARLLEAMPAFSLKIAFLFHGSCQGASHLGMGIKALLCNVDFLERHRGRWDTFSYDTSHGWRRAVPGECVKGNDIQVFEKRILLK